MKRRLPLSVIAALVLLAAIAGCGGGSRGTSPSTTVDPLLFVPNYVSSLNGLRHWDHVPVTVYFNLPAGWAARYQGRDVLAADEWNQPGKQALLRVVSVSAGANVTVSFVSKADFGGNIQGRTEFTYIGSVMQSASVEVALDLPGGAPVSASFAQEIIAHELGHALGIEGHSPNPDDLMFPTSAINSSTVPDTRDLNTIMTAYSGYFTRSGLGTEAHEPHTGPVSHGVIE